MARFPKKEHCLGEVYERNPERFICSTVIPVAIPSLVFLRFA